MFSVFKYYRCSVHQSVTPIIASRVVRVSSLVFIRKRLYENKSHDMALSGKQFNALRPLCLIFVVIGHYTINIPIRHAMCCLTATSKSAKAFKHPIPCPTPLYVLLSPSGQTSKYIVIRCKESFQSIAPEKLRYVLFKCSLLIGTTTQLHSVVVVFSKRNRFVVTTTYS